MPHCTPGKEIRDGGRQQVRRAVAIERQRFRALVGDDADGCVLVQRKGEIDETAVDDAGERRFGQPRRNPLGDIAHQRAGGYRAMGSIGECDVDLTHSGLSIWFWMVLRLASLAQDTRPV